MGDALTQIINVKDSQPEAPKAIVVGILLAGEDSEQFSEDLNELESLLKTLGISCCQRVVQKRARLTAKCLIGTGKVAEIKSLAKENGANLVVIDRALSPPQVRNLEKMTCCQVLDRAGVILDIFSRHARTNQAKTQVEIAQLEYLLPRLSGAWTHFQRQMGGGVRSRGMGEKQIEIDRRRARERIARLQTKLQSIVNERKIQRKSRQNEIKVAIVGYTNSGKTTVMNALTNADLQADNVLFATLDANVRTLDPSSRPKILLSDTVGFIRNLPHGLIESFKSTLDEVLEADLLLHVVDVSHAKYRDQMATTQAVLEEIGAAGIPRIYIFNKVDQLEDPHLPKILQQAHKESLTISAYQEGDIGRLRQHILDYFDSHLLRSRLCLSPENKAALSLIYQCCIIEKSDYSLPDVVIFEVRATRSVLAKLAAYSVEKKAVALP